MRIKNEERWIRQSIESQLPVCRQVLVLDDHSPDSTRNIVESFGDRCMLIESPFEGVNEARDKTYLLQQVFLLRPDWVLWIDSDEKVVNPRQVQKYLHDNRFNGYGVRQHHFACDTNFAPDMPVRFFRRNPRNGKPLSLPAGKGDAALADHGFPAALETQH